MLFPFLFVTIYFSFSSAIYFLFSLAKNTVLQPYDFRRSYLYFLFPHLYNSRFVFRNCIVFVLRSYTFPADRSYSTNFLCFDSCIISVSQLYNSLPFFQVYNCFRFPAILVFKLACLRLRGFRYVNQPPARPLGGWRGGAAFVSRWRYPCARRQARSRHNR